MPYGVFVEFLSGKDGLLHISEMDWKRLETIEESGLKEGDTIKVKLLDIDPKTGKFKLSHRVLLPKPEGHSERQERGDRPSHKDHRNHNDRREYRPNKPQRQEENDGNDN